MEQRSSKSLKKGSYHDCQIEPLLMLLKGFSAVAGEWDIARAT